MPNATLTFKLPEEQSEYRVATRGREYMSALYDIVDMLRNKTKYTDYKLEEESSMAWKFRDDVWDILKEYGIDPYEE